jgi:hypothetical protein
MPTLLIVSHTPSPNTLSLTRAVVEGASDDSIEGVDVVCQSPFDTEPRDVNNADAIILGTTENFGYMSGALKDFFDRIYYPCLEKSQGTPYALFVKGGLDGTGACASVERIVSGMKWRAVQAPLIMKGDYRADWLPGLQNLGMALAVGLESGIF